MPRSGVSGSYDNSILNFLKNLTILFCTAVASFYIPTNSVQAGTYFLTIASHNPLWPFQSGVISCLLSSLCPSRALKLCSSPWFSKRKKKIPIPSPLSPPWAPGLLVGSTFPLQECSGATFPPEGQPHPLAPSPYAPLPCTAGQCHIHCRLPQGSEQLYLF